MEWNVEDQPPELWDQFKTDFEKGTHIRIHPLLHWTELNIWEYIERVSITVIPLYFVNVVEHSLELVPPQHENSRELAPPKVADSRKLIAQKLVPPKRKGGRYR